MVIIHIARFDNISCGIMFPTLDLELVVVVVHTLKNDTSMGVGVGIGRDDKSALGKRSANMVCNASAEATRAFGTVGGKPRATSCA